MSSKKYDGGSAFPLDANEYAGHGPVAGMTLRDYFAAQSLNGLMGRHWDSENKSAEQIFKMWAASAYSVADAMLAAREVQK